MSLALASLDEAGDFVRRAQAYGDGQARVSEVRADRDANHMLTVAKVLVVAVGLCPAGGL
jgi:hypothetical protein